MTNRKTLLLWLAIASLSGCATVSESRFNPFNWFGQSETSPAPEPVVVVQDSRPLVPQITALVVERTPGGAIIRATGLPPTQGWYGAALVSATDGPENGVLSYSFRAIPPATVTRTSTQQSREMTAAVFVSDIILRDVRIIRVLGGQNIRSVRR